MTLDQARVGSISLTYKVIGRRDQYGNRLRYSGEADVAIKKKMRKVKIYDVFFVGSY